MKQSKASFVASLACAVFVLGASTAGCSTTHDGMMGGDGTTETRSGYAQSRAGLDHVREGTTTYKAGKSGPGRDGMRGGVAQFSGGLDMMRSGLRMMSGDMMGRCGGSPENMMDGLDRGLGAMRGGMDMLDDADPTNDAEGMAKMDSGEKAAEDGMGAMDGATSCMGHGRMM